MLSPIQHRAVRLPCLLLALWACGKSGSATPGHPDAGSGQSGAGGTSNSTVTSGAGGFFSSGGVGAGGIGFGGSGGVAVPTTSQIGADGLIDALPALDMVVAPDEHHVAYMRDYLSPATCAAGGEAFYARARQIGTLVVATLSSDGVVVTRVVAQSVKSSSVHFTADSKSLVYVDNYEPCSRGGRLQTAASDGSSPRTIDSLGVYFDIATVGTALLYGQSQANGVNDRIVAVHLPDGAPVAIPNTFNTWTSSLKASLDGRWIGTFDDKKALTIVDVNAASTHPVDLGTQAGSFDTLRWSPDGKFMALTGSYAGAQVGGLAIAPSDGTKVQSLVASNWIVSAAFSPDGKSLAYGAPNATGGFEVVVHPLAQEGGSDRHVANYPDPKKSYGDLSFSADGGLVLVTSSAIGGNSTAGTSVYAASALTDGTLTLVTTNVHAAVASPPGDKYLAVPLDSGYTGVFSLSGGDSNVVPGIIPSYQPQTTQPLLLLAPSVQPSNGPAPPAFLLASTDGKEVTPVMFPSGISPWQPGAQWIGHSVVYGGADGTGPTGIYALVAGAASSTMLAARPDTYAWAPIPQPTQLFYARQATNSAGGAGLYVKAFP